MAVPAPARFSTISGTPIDCDRSGESARGMMSPVLPGGNGATIVIRRDGKVPSCVRPAVENTAHARARAPLADIVASRSDECTPALSRRTWYAPICGCGLLYVENC